MKVLFLGFLQFLKSKELKIALEENLLLCSTRSWTMQPVKSATYS